MRSALRASSRALLAAAVAGAALSITVAAGAPPASAHVHVEAADAAPGSTSILTFRVPGESDNGSLTTQFSVALPDVASARTELMSGWTSRLDRDAGAGTVRSVTWTADPNVGISAEQFALFRVSVRLPDQPSVTLPATQTYSDGTVVRWDQAPLPGGEEPEHPAPVLTLTGTVGGDHDHPAPPAAEAPGAEAPTVVASTPAQTQAGSGDDAARWLAGGALVLAAVAVVVSILRRRSA